MKGERIDDKKEPDPTRHHWYHDQLFRAKDWSQIPSFRRSGFRHDLYIHFFVSASRDFSTGRRKLSRNFRWRASRLRKLSCHAWRCLHSYRRVFGGASIYQTVSRLQDKDKKSRRSMSVLS